MKPTLKTLLILLALLAVTPLTASASSYPSRMGLKLGNGIANAVTGIGELPKAIMVSNRAHGPAYAASAGLVTGLFHMVGRTLLGAGDVATFMIPTKPIIQPDFIWENFKQETTYRKTWELLP
ncbi:MAG: exosortase system-associated protein, TIGR04073 family [Methylococcales bacterium]|nr:exosortase system-associated protein, TIGR04073 family [Methylococcales bacterium]